MNLTIVFPHKTLTKKEKENLQKIVPYHLYTKHYVLYEDAIPMSGGDFYIYSTNLRGNLLQNAGVADIVTIPEGRRKGFTKKIFKEMFDDMKKMSIEISTLYPFKSSFYEKFGYVSCGGANIYTIPMINIEYLTNYSSKNYYFERKQISDLGKEFYKEYYSLIKEIQKRIHGYTIHQHLEMIEDKFTQDSYCLLIRKKFDDSLAGFMKYSLEDPLFLIDRNFIILNEEVKYLMFHFVSLNSDHSNLLKFEIPPNITPGNYLPDLTSQMESVGRSIQMGRIMIVEGLNGMNLSCRDSCITLGILDDFCEWNQKTFLFEVKNGKLKVEIQEKESEKKLDIRGLSSFVFGSVHDVSLIDSRNWGNLDEEDLKILWTMFPYQIPVFHEYF